VKLDNCEFTIEVSFFVRVSGDGILVEVHKIKAIQQWPHLKLFIKRNHFREHSEVEEIKTSTVLLLSSFNLCLILSLKLVSTLTSLQNAYHYVPYMGLIHCNY